MRQGLKTRGNWKTVRFHLPQALFPLSMLNGFCFTEETTPGSLFSLGTEGWPGFSAQVPSLLGVRQSRPHATALGVAVCGRAEWHKEQCAATGPLLGCCGKLQGMAQPPKAKAFVLVFETLH